MKQYIYSDHQVLRAIQKSFPKKDSQEILDLLNLYDDQSEGKQRVFLAVLKLCKGDEGKLLDFLKIAQTDFRDVLLWAEYGKDSNEIPDPYKELIN